MLRLLLSLAALGLVSVDPVGIGVMPLLLLQKKPLWRSFIFLAGSFCALELVGFIFASGFGAIVLHVERTKSWLVPSLEALAGGVLLIIAAIGILQGRRHHKTATLPSMLSRRLKGHSHMLFAIGAGLVTLQSLVDVVFIVATIRIGRMQLSSFRVIIAVTTYALAALLLQIIVVAAYQVTPAGRRQTFIMSINQLLKQHAQQVITTISFVLGCSFILIALAQH